MKVHYDNEVDALYLEFGTGTPDGVVEVADGLNIDTTSDNQIVGIEILNASKRIDIQTVLSYTLDVDQELLAKKTA